MTLKCVHLDCKFIKNGLILYKAEYLYIMPMGTILPASSSSCGRVLTIDVSEETVPCSVNLGQGLDRF